MSIADKLTTVAENVSKVYEAGKKAEYDRFWDEYQKNGTRTNYWGAFALWTDENFKPKYPIVVSNGGLSNYMFYESNITEIATLTLNCSTLNGTFSGAKKLHTIEKMIIPSNGNLQFLSNPFLNTSSLENIKIEGVIGQNGLSFQWSTKLSADSVINIVNALSATTSGLTVTLAKIAVNSIDWSATEYGSFENLAATKQNWNIALI